MFFHAIHLSGPKEALVKHKKDVFVSLDFSKQNSVKLSSSTVSFMILLTYL